MRTSAALAVPAAARTCAAAVPPSSRASRAVRTTVKHGADGCRDPNRNEVVAEHRSRQPSEERRERRLVGVPPGEMVAKKPEIQLIAVIAVTRRGNEENRGQSRRN